MIKNKNQVVTTNPFIYCNFSSAAAPIFKQIKGTNKFLLEIKESFLIKRDKPKLNKNISSAPLFIFDEVYI